MGSEGNVYSWGSNRNGQLGNGTTSWSYVPIKADFSAVPSGEKIVAISTSGDGGSLAVDTAGNVYSWGDNSNGQLGDGTNEAKYTPAMINVDLPNGEKIVSVASGENDSVLARGYHSLALDSTGKVHAWGCNYSGQLGIGNTVEYATPIKTDFSILPEGREIVEVATGYAHSLALDSAGDVYAWGYDYFGQLGDGSSGYTTYKTSAILIDFSIVPSGEKIVSIVAEGHHSYAIDSAGNVYAWGRNNNGQLGDGTTTTRAVPTKTDLSIVPSGEKIVAIESSTSVTYISGGAVNYFHTLALDTAGNVYAWGYNTQYQLGDGTRTTRTTPIKVDLSMVPSGEEIVAISAGGEFSLALDSAGTIYAWGYNGNVGRLGIGNTTAQTTIVKTDLSIVPSGEKIVAIEAGVNGSMALDSAGNLYGWGSNSNGIIGDGTTATQLTPVAVDTSAIPSGEEIVAMSKAMYVNTNGNSGDGSPEYSVIMDSAGNIYTWGMNTYGQLGDGTKTNRSIMAKVEIAAMPDDARAVSFSAKGGHTLVVGSDGGIYAWGWNYYGQLENGLSYSIYSANPTDFSEFEPDVSVMIGGNECLNVKVVSITSIKCTTQAHAAGAVDVVVSNGLEFSTLRAGYTYLDMGVPNTGA